MHSCQAWRLLWFLLLTACGQQIPALTHTPSPTVVLRSLPSATSSSAPPTMAVTPMLATPVSPTATPMVHTVRQGDTLLGIAAEHGVTLEALQVVNGGLDPLSIQPGQTLILPMLEGIYNSAILLTHTPLPLEMGQFRCYVTRTRGHLCLGEVRNPGDEPVTNLVAQVTTVMQDGTAGASETAFAPLDILWPGQSLPLSARFAASGRVQGAMAQVLSADSGAALVDRFAELSIEAVSGAAGDPSGYLVSGQVFNDGEMPASEIRIVVTLYGEDGAVSAFRQIKMTETLPSQAGIPFNMVFPLNVEEISYYAADALGRVSANVEN